MVRRVFPANGADTAQVASHREPLVCEEFEVVLSIQFPQLLKRGTPCQFALLAQLEHISTPEPRMGSDLERFDLPLPGPPQECGAGDAQEIGGHSARQLLGRLGDVHRAVFRDGGQRAEKCSLHLRREGHVVACSIAKLSLIHISEPTRRLRGSRMPSSA